MKNAPLSRLENVVIEAIRDRRVLKFVYHNAPRWVEPQACGISTAGHPVLRGYQRAGGSQSRQTRGLKLYELAKISSLEKTNERFAGARPEHNPHDKAMIEIHAALPAPSDNSRFEK